MKNSLQILDIVILLGEITLISADFDDGKNEYCESKLAFSKVLSPTGFIFLPGAEEL